MYCYLLQDWITLRGTSAITVLTQPEAQWFDASLFQDAVAWVDVEKTTFSSGAPTLAFQTAATKDDVFFVNMGSQSFSAPGKSVIVMLKETAPTPLSQWLRWQLQVSSGATWDITFRVFCALNAVGSNRPTVAPG
jgi:hypothetical protein